MGAPPAQALKVATLLLTGHPLWEPAHWALPEQSPLSGAGQPFPGILYCDEPGSPRFGRGGSVSAPRSPASLRKLIDAEGGLLLPGVANALTARIAEDLGFDAVYVTGAGVSNTFLGLPDIGLLSLETTARADRGADLPVVRGTQPGAVHLVFRIPWRPDALTGFSS
ncbi:hypothetical protein [Actinacidiphila oryziradicis]|uniref:Uncharacterized protein n=1 Tax=Actinacidiphila oryziradicis TaxID=2571141 RepID=A0A4U0S0B1_9ACTN|nr:hypothetical protein [Actinacidiphila oryziradicis]TKA02180.1 hypothetical protein FCI23_38705 [Actinacidiphila oryziradicis]